MYKRVIWILGLTLSVGLAGCGGSDGAAVSRTLRAILSGLQMVPATNSAASGAATVIIAPDSQSIQIIVEVEGLTDVTAVRLNLGAAGSSGDPLFNLFTPADGAFPASLTRTLTSANLMPVGNVNTFGEVIGAVTGGRTYLVVETAANPTGAIRGQVGPVRLTTNLSGANEVPPVTTSANGTVTVELNDTQTSLTVRLSTQGLGNPTAAHLHAGATGVNGPPIFLIYSAQAHGALTSPFERTLTSADLLAGGVDSFAEAIGRLLGGGVYANVHTTGNPDGEIRGQLTAN